MELFTGYAVVLEGDKFPRSCRRRMRLAYLGLFFNGLWVIADHCPPPTYPIYSRGGRGMGVRNELTASGLN